MTSEQATLHQALQDRLRFEAMLSDLSSRFVGLPSGEVDREIEHALRDVCELLAIDLAVLWQWSSVDPSTIRATQRYSAQEDSRSLESLRQDQFPWYVQQMLAGRTIAIASLQELPAEAAVDRESGRLSGIKSSLCLPLMVGGAPPLGALAFNTVRGERNWPEELVNRLQLVAQIFANALDRKRAEQALRASEARLVAGADLAGLGYYEANFDDGVMYMDERLRDLCGPPPEVLGLQALEFWMEHLHPDDRPRVMHDRDRLHGGVVDRISTDYRYLHPDRGERWFQHVAHVGSRDADGRAIGTYGVLRDITERKRSEDDLRSLSRRLIGAHEEERARLARELHDDLTQRLASLAISLGLLGPTPTGSSATETISVVRDGLARLSEDVHALAYRLHPTMLEDLGLVEAVRAECDRVARQESLAIEQELQQTPKDTSREVALGLFRVAQESLRNVARHAMASRVIISLCGLDDGLQLTVHDDGVGFQQTDRRHFRHLGIASMRERIDLLSGQFELDSKPGEGTTVRAWVPCKGPSK